MELHPLGAAVTNSGCDYVFFSLFSKEYINYIEFMSLFGSRI